LYQRKGTQQGVFQLAPTQQRNQVDAYPAFTGGENFLVNFLRCPGIKNIALPGSADSLLLPLLFDENILTTDNSYPNLKRPASTVACAIILALVLCACSLTGDLSITPSPEITRPTEVLATTAVNVPAEIGAFALPTEIKSPTPLPQISPTPPGPPTPVPSPTPFVCRQTKGVILQDQLSTDLLRYPIDFRIYLPPCYEQETQRSYPVLYLLHGQSYNDDQWDRLGADEAADALITSAEAGPFIIVMPRYRIWFQPDEHNFGQAMLETLIPHIDAHYRTIPERSQRAIGGLSMGAAWALHLGLSQWEMFGAIGLHSLALFSIDSSRIPGWLDAIPPDQLPRIYIDIGDKDNKNLLDSTRWFEETLTQKDIPHEWFLFSGYHEEKYWREHTEGYLRWYTRDW
jgi:enterochelin esterase-like enzyme